MTFPEQIKSQRERLGLTQAELAAFLDVSPRAVWQWEKGTLPHVLTQEGALARLSKAKRRSQGVVVHRLVGPPEDDDPDLCEECGGTDYVCAAMSNGRMSPPELCPLCWPNKHHTPRLQQTLTRAALEAVRALCLEALRDYRAYRKIHPEAFQVSACSERKGAARLARRISRLFKRPNALALPEAGRNPTPTP